MKKTVYYMCTNCGSNIIPYPPGNHKYYKCPICGETYELLEEEEVGTEAYKKEKTKYYKKIDKLDKRLARKVKLHSIKHRFLSLLMPIWVVWSTFTVAILFTQVAAGITIIACYLALSLFIILGQDATKRKYWISSLIVFVVQIICLLLRIFVITI